MSPIVTTMSAPAGQGRRVKAPVVTPPTESIGVALNNTAFSGRRSNVSSRTLTLTRNGGYSGTVSFAVSGLPTGTTAAFSPTTLSGATLTTTVTLTHASDASLVTDDAFVITASGSGVSDATVNATVTVEEAVAFTPNLPGGFTTLSDVTFDATFDNTDVGSPTSYTYKGLSITKYANQKSTVVSDASAPNGTSYKMGVKWINGQTFGYGSQIDPTTYTTEKNHIFAAFTFQPGAGFVYESNTYKVFYPTARIDGSSTGSKAYLGIRSTPGTVTDGRCQLSLEQFSRWTGSAFSAPNLFNNMNGYTQSSPYWLNNGTFYRIELELKMESPNITSGPADGIARVWVSEWTGSAWTSPVLTHEYTDVMFGGTVATTSKVFANLVMWDFYRGGGGTPTLTADQFLYMDRVVFCAAT